MNCSRVAALFLHRSAGGSAFCLGVAAVCLLVAGSQISAAGAPAISQSFQASGSGLTIGALVGLQPDSPNTVELANTARIADMVGVVADKPLVELGAGGDAQVVTSGVTNALVSDINGDITNGDKVTVSPLNGIGMKVSKPTLIIGTAQADLSTAETTERTVTDREGQTQAVNVGLIPIDVSVTFHAATATQQEFVPPFLQNTADAIAGKPVSPVRVIAGLMVMILALISVMVLLYSSVRSSIISIGRNPLSEQAVHKSLLEVGVIVLVILSLTFITIYLILAT